MNIQGKLIGFNKIQSKKGTDCFFGWIIVPFSDDDKNAMGSKAIQICAFKDDCEKIFDSIRKDQLINKEVDCLGSFSNNSFNVLQITKK